MNAELELLLFGARLSVCAFALCKEDNLAPVKKLRNPVSPKKAKHHQAAINHRDKLETSLSSPSNIPLCASLNRRKCTFSSLKPNLPELEIMEVPPRISHDA